jgi:hypothetical protein
LALPFWLLQADEQYKGKSPQLTFHVLCSAWMFGISDLNSVWFLPLWLALLLARLWESVTNQCWLALYCLYDAATRIR